MKKFSISHWGVSILHPTKTAVAVNVLEEVVPGIVKRTPFEFMVEGRFERMSVDFHLAIGGTLTTAGLISQEEFEGHMVELQTEVANATTNGNTTVTA